MARLETKQFEKFAAELFHLAYLKNGSFSEAAGKIGTSGHYVSDIVKGVYQPTAPIFLACLAEVVPWLPEEIERCVRKAGKEILEQRKAAEAAAAKESCSPNIGYLPGSPEGANA